MYSLVRRCPIKLLVSTIELVLVAGRVASSNLNYIAGEEYAGLMECKRLKSEEKMILLILCWSDERMEID